MLSDDALVRRQRSAPPRAVPGHLRAPPVCLQPNDPGLEMLNISDLQFETLKKATRDRFDASLSQHLSDFAPERILYRPGPCACRRVGPDPARADPAVGGGRRVARGVVRYRSAIRPALAGPRPPAFSDTVCGAAPRCPCRVCGALPGAGSATPRSGACRRCRTAYPRGNRYRCLSRSGSATVLATEAPMDGRSCDCGARRARRDDRRRALSRWKPPAGGRCARCLPSASVRGLSRIR